MKPEELKQYKLLENKLNEFFKATNFCMDECITQETSLYSKQIKPSIDIHGSTGCCIRNFNYINFENKKEIETPKEKIKRKNEFIKKQKQENENTCNSNNENEYCLHHDKNKGCLIKTYKPPICISFICTEYKNELMNKYNISYSNSNTRQFLEDVIFTTTSNFDRIKKMKNTLNEATERIKNHKEGNKYKNRILI